MIQWFLGKAKPHGPRGGKPTCPEHAQRATENEGSGIILRNIGAF